MRTALASLSCFAALVAVSGPAASETPSAPIPAIPSTPAPAITLDPGKAAEIVCETKAVVVAEGAPAATKGVLTLRLAPGDPSPTTQGTWTVASVDSAHTGSLATTQRDACKAGCPFTVAAAGEIRLWAPAPKMLDALKPGETLLLAVVRPDAALRASTFKGQQIEALEEGYCKKVDP